MSVTAEGILLVAHAVSKYGFEIQALDATGNVLATAPALVVSASGALRFSATLVGVSRSASSFVVRGVTEPDGGSLSFVSGSVAFAEFAVLAPDVGPDNSYQVIYTLPLGGTC